MRKPAWPPAAVGILRCVILRVFSAGARKSSARRELRRAGANFRLSFVLSFRYSAAAVGLDLSIFGAMKVRTALHLSPVTRNQQPSTARCLIRARPSCKSFTVFEKFTASTLLCSAPPDVGYCCGLENKIRGAIFEVYRENCYL